MKSLRFMTTAIIAVVTSPFTFGQMHDHSQMTSAKTETFKVWGNCDMCKARIEKAAKIEGVSKADWNKDSKILTIEYDLVLTSSNNIQKRIAAIGHDTEKFRADDKVYAKLPGCCQYKRIELKSE